MSGTSNISGDESIIFADNASFNGTERGGKMTTDGQFFMGATASPHVRLGTLTSTNGSITLQYTNPTADTANIDLSVSASNDAILTLTPDADFDGSGATPISPQSGNVNILSYNPSFATVTDTLNTTGTATGNLSIEHRAWLTGLVVDPSATIGTRGTYQTIAAALTAASSGQDIFIRPGTYTENLTLKAGVNLVGFKGDASTPQVTILGNATFSGTGTVSISNIRLQTNSGALLTVSGSSASIVNLQDCYLNCTNNTGITYSSSSASSAINIQGCTGDLGTTGIALFAHSSAGTLFLLSSDFTNSGGSSTANTASAGSLAIRRSSLTNPITTSSTNSISFFQAQISTSAQNATSLTVGGSGTNSITNAILQSGTASALSVGSTLNAYDVTIASSNTNSITGAGTLNFSGITFTSSSGINTTTTAAGIFRPGILRSDKQPAFLAYLGTSDLNQTGNSGVYTLGSGNALTEVFDQNNNFATNGVFTAPYTGKYQLSTSIFVTGTTVATVFVLNIVTSNRTYFAQVGRAASAQNECVTLSVLADMDAADTATVTMTVAGEAGNTDDILGGSTAASSFGGFLVC